MNKYSHHTYKYTKPFGSPRHSWSFVGEKGGLDFHVTIYEGRDFPDSAGLEIHRFEGQGAPSHLDCWLLKGRCWHDGTSLYASETVWPIVKSMRFDHDAIFNYLECEADRYFGVRMDDEHE